MALTGTLHLLSIGAALGSVAMTAEIESWAAWPLGGFLGIGLYLMLVGVEYAVAPALPLAPHMPGPGEEDDEQPGRPRDEE
jgi:hypothetical protein